MNRFHTAFAIVLFLTLSVSALAQPGRGRSDQGRLEQFRTLRLIEALRLEEDEAARFAAKQSAHERNIRDLMRKRNDAVDKIESAVRDSADQQDLVQQIEAIREIDRQMLEERERYHEELRGLFTTVQFAKFLVFERNFGRNVRDAMRDMRGRDRRYR